MFHLLKLYFNESSIPAFTCRTNMAFEWIQIQSVNMAFDFTAFSKICLCILHNISSYHERNACLIFFIVWLPWFPCCFLNWPVCTKEDITHGQLVTRDNPLGNTCTRFHSLWETELPIFEKGAITISAALLKSPHLCSSAWIMKQVGVSSSNDISMSRCYMKGTHAFHDTVYFPVRLSLEKCHHERGKTATTFGWWRDPGYWLWERERGSTQEKGSAKGLLQTRKSNQLVMIIVPERRAAKERGEKRNER